MEKHLKSLINKKFIFNDVIVRLRGVSAVKWISNVVVLEIIEEGNSIHISPMDLKETPDVYLTVFDKDTVAELYKEATENNKKFFMIPGSVFVDVYKEYKDNNKSKSLVVDDYFSKN